MFSGVPLYLSFFYPRDKVGFRQGIFLSGSALANAYGGVLGYAILGIRGSVAPWRCLFLIEGLPVWIVAILAWFYLPDDLLSAKFPTDREKEVASQCVGRGQTVDSQGAGGVSWAEWRSAFLDWRSYVPGLMYFSCNVCFGSLPLFIPTIISEMGTFNHYSKLLPGIFNENEVNCESYLKESSLLFWTIIATGSRHLEHATKLHRIAVQHIRGGTFQPLLHITNPITIIKISLILCIWPLPVDTMWKDPSHVYTGTAHSLAVQNRLFVNGHEQDFARTHTSLSKEIRDIRAHLWLNCCLVFQATSLYDGLPYLSISESKPHQRKTRLEEIVDASFHYRIKCHDILIDATRAFGDIIDEQGEGRSSVNKWKSSHFLSVMTYATLPGAAPVSQYQPTTSSYRVMTFKRPGLITTFSIATEVLDAVSRLDAMQDFALFASN
ncbi:hypothetical protein FOQG_08555 [Fusarium oxysporum f. sp. raphani 54005]|uniref:Major facilitator superfamily (MFS) profile domain-containing protein n=1 Tax=Fusarium oxysporum f. sp. raphani 54005 TaxID=1089458 RepID=X0C1B5_FUSOX|nr:hypothetical protein FOQG_08555 [Fusarium oxysporum f. sp. raphani 54005]